MGFDLYFLEHIPGRTWIQAMEDLEDDDDGRPLSDADLRAWERLVAALAPVLPDAAPGAGDESRALDDPATGIQVAFSPAEISVSVPSWVDGSETEPLGEVLRGVAAVIEGETGLVAYDPQADQPFLAAGDDGPDAADPVQRLLLLEGGGRPPPGGRRPRRRFRR